MKKYQQLIKDFLYRILIHIYISQPRWKKLVIYICVSKELDYVDLSIYLFFFLGPESKATLEDLGCVYLDYKAENYIKDLISLSGLWIFIFNQGFFVDN